MPHESGVMMKIQPYLITDRLREMRDEKKLSQAYIEKAKRVVSLLLFPESTAAILFLPFETLEKLTCANPLR